MSMINKTFLFKGKDRQTQVGFALLITIIVVTAIVSIGISMIDLSLKQVRLSLNAKQSELAFHAATAGVECASYWRRAASSTMEVGGTLAPRCFGEVSDPPSVDVSTGPTSPSKSGSDGQVHLYKYRFTWGVSGSQRCTEIDTLVMIASTTNDTGTNLGSGVTTTNMTTVFSGYDGDINKGCGPGERCTVHAVRGYNMPCSNLDNYGAVQREILLEL